MRNICLQISTKASDSNSNSALPVKCKIGIKGWRFVVNFGFGNVRVICRFSGMLHSAGVYTWLYLVMKMQDPPTPDNDYGAISWKQNLQACLTG
jgi:hypothetical protein